MLPGASTTAALTVALSSVVGPGVTLCTDGSKALRGAAMALELKHVALVAARRQRKRGIYHVQTVNSYQGRLKGWMRWFRGVATKPLFDLAHATRARSATFGCEGQVRVDRKHGSAGCTAVLSGLRRCAECRLKSRLGDGLLPAR